jgi:predicted ATPase
MGLQMDSDRFVVISGCSGGGKSTLLAELGRRGYATVEEPGRRIVREEMRGGGTALPWVDATAFLRRVIALSLEDRIAAGAMAGWVFFDRGLIDAVAGLDFLTRENGLARFEAAQRYHAQVFMAPPWPEIYVSDPERRHDLAAAVAEYERLLPVYVALGYQIVALPKVPVQERADFLLNALFGRAEGPFY